MTERPVDRADTSEEILELLQTEFPILAPLTSPFCIAMAITYRGLGRRFLIRVATIDNKYYVTGIRNSLKPDVQMRVSIT